MAKIKVDDITGEWLKPSDEAQIWSAYSSALEAANEDRLAHGKPSNGLDPEALGVENDLPTT